MKLKPMKDIDVAAHAQGMRVLPFSLLVACAGGAVGAAGALAMGANPLLGMIPGFVFGGGGFYGVATGMAEATGRGLARLIYSSGSGTPARPDFSRAEALVVRGQLDEAVVAYLLYADEAPSDPEPCLRLARLLRDRLGQNEEAVVWLRRARDAAPHAPGAQLAMRELVDLLVHRMREPARVLPDLARFAEARAGTPAGDWATGQLETLREAVWKEGAAEGARPRG